MNWKALGHLAAFLTLVLFGQPALVWLLFAIGAVGTAISDLVNGSAPGEPLTQLALAVPTIAILSSALYWLFRQTMRLADDLRQTRDDRKRRSKHPPSP